MTMAERSGKRNVKQFCFELAPKRCKWQNNSYQRWKSVPGECGSHRKDSIVNIIEQPTATDASGLANVQVSANKSTLSDSRLTSSSIDWMGRLLSWPRVNGTIQ